MRRLIIALLLLCAARPAAARGAVIINTGDDILFIRDLPEDLASAAGFRKLGYHYHRFGVFWLDVWRWSGEVVVYDEIAKPAPATDILDSAVAARDQLASNNAELRGMRAGGSIAVQGEAYVPLTDEILTLLGGASVPLRYHLPPGLIVLLGLLELAIITRTRRSLKVTLAVGVAMFGIAIVFLAEGLDREFLVPALLGVHHTLGSWLALRRANVAEQPAAASDPVEPLREPPPPRESPPRVETDPFRAPPAAPPIVVVRPPTAPTDAPIVPDDNADGPKLLG